MPVLEGLGPALAAVAARRGMKPADLGRKIGRGKSTISKWLAPNAKPNTKTIEIILEASGATLHDLADELDRLNGRAGEVREPPSGYVLEADFTALARALARIQREDEAREAAAESAQSQGDRKGSPR